MSQQAAHTIPVGIPPPPSPNGASRPLPATPPSQLPQLPQLLSRISTMRTGLIAGGVVLMVMVIFVIQNARVVQVSFLGLNLRLSLAVALIIAAIAGVLLMVAAGPAWITELRRIIRREWHRAQPRTPAKTT